METLSIGSIDLYEIRSKCKLLNIYENIDINRTTGDEKKKFSVKEERITRGHGVTLALAKVQCRLNIKQFSFIQRTVNE